jgi:GDP-L-fucose synthase
VSNGAETELDEPVVVTGGRGFLGRFVTEELRERGFRHVFPLGSSDYDLIRPEAVQRMYKELRPARVIHLAAAVGGIGANKEHPGWFSYANTMMGAGVIEGARIHGVRKLVVIGTICVYPAEAPVPTPETAMFEGFPAGDTAPYGIAKRNVWSMGAAYRTQYGMPVIFLIPTNLYGPHDHFDEERSHVIPALIRRLVEAREKSLPQVVVWGDGSATREFLHAADAARGIADAMSRYDDAEPVNLGTGEEVSIRTLAETIRDLVGYHGKLVWDASKPAGAPRRSLDVSRAEREFGFSARVGLTAGLRSTIEWYEKKH